MDERFDTSKMKQQDLPLALVRGEIVIDKPQDLFIPPDALEIFLEAFEGPLDFLLYLIKKQKFDIVDLPVLEITRQYMEYVEVMRELKLELAAEYLVMAAMLAEIKSRLLLPKHKNEDDDEIDPRMELIHRLQKYEIIKNAATELDALDRQERDFVTVSVCEPTNLQVQIPEASVELSELVIAFQSVLKRASAFSHHEISTETISTRERMSQILSQLKGKNDFTLFTDLFDVKEGKQGVVVTFLAVLELIKEHYLDMVQASAFGQIHVKCKGNDSD